MAQEEEAKQSQISIELSEEIAEGEYANLATIAHSNSEFVINFIRLMPGTPKAKVKLRIIVTPEHAKRLLYALKDNINKLGKTPLGQSSKPTKPLSFRSTSAEPLEKLD